MIRCILEILEAERGWIGARARGVAGRAAGSCRDVIPCSLEVDSVRAATGPSTPEKHFPSHLPPVMALTALPPEVASL